MKSPRQLIDRRVPAKQAWQECESLLQIQVVTASAAFMDEYPEIALLHSIPNGDWRGPRVAQKLKAEGVLPGIPDLCLPVPRGGYHGMYLELKAAGGTVKPDQWRIMQELHAHGYFVILTNCYHVAMKSIEEYVSCRVMRFEEESKSNADVGMSDTFASENVDAMEEENRHLKDQLATLSKTRATDMQRLSDMIDKRQEALRHISNIMEEKASKREDLEIGSTSYKSVRRWASLFLHNAKLTHPESKP